MLFAFISFSISCKKQNLDLQRSFFEKYLFYFRKFTYFDNFQKEEKLKEIEMYDSTLLVTNTDGLFKILVN